MTIAIIGAGLAGLLAGNMLRHRSVIYEQQPDVPNNHSALLRFKTGVFGTAVGIPFREVTMIKGVFGDNSNPIANVINYTLKTIGEARTDRSMLGGFVQEKRYVAPRDLVQQMALMAPKINYSALFFRDDFNTIAGPIISTIPMPVLMEILDYPMRRFVEFKARKGMNINAVIENCDAYATLYYPNSNTQAYRASITGNQLIIEFIDDGSMVWNDNTADATAAYYARHFGISPKMIHAIEIREQKYAKILPIDDEIRRDFMHWATDKHNIYSLGRYATWRPGLLLDDLVSDVNKIAMWTMKGGKYGAAKHRT